MAEVARVAEIARATAAARMDSARQTIEGLFTGTHPRP